MGMDVQMVICILLVVGLDVHVVLMCEWSPRYIYHSAKQDFFYLSIYEGLDGGGGGLVFTIH